jgi:hypothetical protein
MTKVVYVKLVTGEQLLATVMKYEGDVVVLGDPLELTFSDNENGSGSFIYLARYSPFMNSPTIRLAREHLIHMEPVMESAAVYYQTSLAYVRTKSDVSFANAVDEATTYINNLMRKSAKPPSAKREESPDELADGLIDVLSGNVTLH